MLLRAVQEFVIHFESFRNIDVWYQGAYLLNFTIYASNANQKPQQGQIVHAHPFAFTEHYSPGDPQSLYYDSQVIKPASIDHPSSSFCSKAFLLRYYEEEVELNDICHLRVQSDISQAEQEYVLKVDLYFFEQQIKKVDPEGISLERGKKVKTNKYTIRRARAGAHTYLQVVFEGQYHSLANITLHSVCLDYRLRMSPLQLSEFSQLSAIQKKKLLEKSRNSYSRQGSYLQAVASQLHMKQDEECLRVVQQISVKGLKENYHTLLKQYGILFGKVIGDYQRKNFSQMLVHPGQLGLFEDQSPGKESWKEQSVKKIKNGNKDEVIQKILNQANLISAELIKLWHHYIDLLKMSPRFSTAYYQSRTLKKMSSFWQHFFRKQPQNTKDLCVCSEDNHKIGQKISNQLLNGRQKIGLDWQVVGQDWSSKSAFPVIVENYYWEAGSKKPKQIEDELALPSSQSENSLHLVVLVHGFQGNSLDMKMIKNTISVLYPQTAFLCATSNEELTDTDIIDMGNRLATEVKNYIIQFFPPDTLQRISFIGHSLGGVIIRAALPRLLDLKDKFHTILTFSSPHLGYKVNGSTVIGAGIWVLQKFKGSNCLKQLTMGDHTDPRQTVLYRISKFQGMKYFKNIYLFSSKQDNYAPYESARIEIHPDFMSAKDPLKEVHCQMVRNILQGVSAQALHRMRVSFTIGGTSIDNMIGRTAHILFLENSQLLQVFLHTHCDIFQ